VLAAVRQHQRGRADERAARVLVRHVAIWASTRSRLAWSSPCRRTSGR
jgi:hypothetical protein